MEQSKCPDFMQWCPSRLVGLLLFKSQDIEETSRHEADNYAALRGCTSEYPDGIFSYTRHNLQYQNSSGQAREITLHTITLQEPIHKSIDLVHHNHLIYFLGLGSVFEYKIGDLTLFARTGLTVHIANYPAAINCFADLVAQGCSTVQNILQRYNVRPDQIILTGDSFGCAVAEYVFMHFYNQNSITLGGRINSNSFSNFRTALDDSFRRDPTGLFGATINQLVMSYWNASPLSTTNICPSLLFMSNREGDTTLIKSQLTAHAANQCGFLDHNLAVKYHLKKDDAIELFPATPDRLPSPTLRRLHWATCVLDHHTRLKMRHDLPSDRVKQIKGDVHNILYSECDPIRAQDLPSGHQEPSNPHLENGCVSGPHNTTEMMEAFLTLSLFYHAQCKIKRTMQSLGWKVATRIAHKRKRPAPSSKRGRLTL